MKSWFIDFQSMTGLLYTQFLPFATGRSFYSFFTKAFLFAPCTVSELSFWSILPFSLFFQKSFSRHIPPSKICYFNYFRLFLQFFKFLFILLISGRKTRKKALLRENSRRRARFFVKRSGFFIQPNTHFRSRENRRRWLPHPAGQR